MHGFSDNNCGALGGFRPIVVDDKNVVGDEQSPMTYHVSDGFRIWPQSFELLEDDHKLFKSKSGGPDVGSLGSRYGFKEWLGLRCDCGGHLIGDFIVVAERNTSRFAMS